MEKYYNEIFNKISDEKKNRILENAISEFSRVGYSNTNINVIADKIGITVGSLYKYFGTKENLFLYCVEMGTESLNKLFEYISNIEGSLFYKINEIIQIIQEHSKEHPGLVNLYNELTTEGNLELVGKLSTQMESQAAGYYTKLIYDAQLNGEILNKSEPGLLALFIDNLFLNLQFSYANAYYKERFKIFIGKDTVNDDDIRKSLLTFIKSALVEA